MSIQYILVSRALGLTFRLSERASKGILHARQNYMSSWKCCPKNLKISQTRGARNSPFARDRLSILTVIRI